MLYNLFSEPFKIISVCFFKDTFGHDTQPVYHYKPIMVVSMNKKHFLLHPFTDGIVSAPQSIVFITILNSRLYALCRIIY